MQKICRQEQTEFDEYRFSSSAVGSLTRKVLKECGLLQQAGGTLGRSLPLPVCRAMR